MIKTLAAREEKINSTEIFMFMACYALGELKQRGVMPYGASCDCAAFHQFLASISFMGGVKYRHRD